MDRLIAFGAGAVLAFGLGYLVGYEMHDNAAAKPDTEASETGVVDARAPKLKSLADLSNQADESLTSDLSEAEVRDLKAMVLPHLTPADVAGWQAARDQYVARFLKENPEIWAVGTDESRGDRFDPAIAQEAEGSYQGQLALAPEQEGVAAPLDFVVELHGYSGKTPEGRLAFHAADGNPIWGVQFRWQHVGTEGQARSVWIVWPDFDRRTGGRFTHLAIRLQSGLDVGKGTSGDLYGLTPDLAWAKAGTSEILKTK